MTAVSRFATSCDVAIVGGGPAGCATALSLRAHAPSLTVAVVDAARDGAPRIGETLPPVARQLLDHLGITAAFEAQAHCATYGNASAWGSDQLADNDFIYGAKGGGWHLDRAAFDDMLVREAGHRGVTVLRGVRVGAVVREGRDWQLALTDGASVKARFIVDATGAAGGIARRLGAKPLLHDALLGFSSFYDDDCCTEERTLVEAFEHGWWYTAALPHGRRVVACMTDADIARTCGVTDRGGWNRELARTKHVGRIIRNAVPREGIVARAARSRILSTPSGDGWLAVGDAASSVDPLSSQGITRALRGGIFASYAIADSLTRNVPDAASRYANFVRGEFAQYLTARSRYYATESRWPSSAFWGRRVAANRVSAKMVSSREA